MALLSHLSCVYQDRKSTCYWSPGQQMVISSKSVHIRSILTIKAWTNNTISSQLWPCHRQRWTEQISTSLSHHRPVSILPCLSKVYETVLAIQLGEYFENIFDQALSAFRAGYSCQDNLLSLVEIWKMALRDHKHAGAILIIWISARHLIVCHMEYCSPIWRLTASAAIASR